MATTFLFRTTKKEVDKMNVILQLGFYLALSYLGDQIASILPFPFPGSVIAMVMLFILLSLKVIKTEQLKDASHFLLAYMGSFFVPPTVGLLESIGLVSNQLWQFFTVVILTTLITLLVTMFVTGFLMRLKEGRKR